MTTNVAVKKSFKGIAFEVTSDKITAIRNGKETEIAIEKGVMANVEFPINQHRILVVATRGVSSKGFSDIADVHWELIHINKQKEIVFAEVIDSINF